MENEAGRLVPDLFVFFRKLDMRLKQVVNTSVLIYLDKPQIGHTMKTNFIKFQTVDLEIYSILIFYKNISPPHFVYHFSRKILLVLYSIN